MSLSNEMSPADIAAVTGGNGFMGDGNGIWWLLVLFLLCGNNGWGGFGGGYDMPYFYNTQTQNDVNRGFDNAALAGQLNGIQSAITGGFGDVALAQCNNTTTLLQSMNGLAMGLQNCCCDNKAGLADLKYTIATEECATRNNSSMNTRDIIASNTANTQAILDKLCALELDEYKRENDNLRTQLNMQNLAASQTAQTARILADNAAQTAALEQYLNPVPIPSFQVANPHCCQQNVCGCN